MDGSSTPTSPPPGQSPGQSYATPLSSLTEHDVVSLLTNLGLEKYTDAALSVPLRGSDLVHCTEADLVAAGVDFRPHRLSLLDLIQGFNAEGVPAALLIAGGPAAAAVDVSDARSDDDVGSLISSVGEMPTWLSEAQEDLAKQASTDVNDSKSDTDSMPGWLTEAQQELKATPALANRTQPSTSNVEDDDNLGPLPPLGARALASRASASSGGSLPRNAALGGSIGGSLGSSGGDTLQLPKGPAETLSGLSEENAALEIHLAEDRGSIRVIQGKRIGPFGAAPYLIGRAPSGIDLTLPGAHISARHATILPPAALHGKSAEKIAHRDKPAKEGEAAPSAAAGGATSGKSAAGDWRLLDTSTNGTLVNGVLVGKGGSVALRSGDTIHFGREGAYPFVVFHLQGSNGNQSPSWRCSSWEAATAPDPLPPGGAAPMPRGSTRPILVLDAVAEASRPLQEEKQRCVVM